MSQTWNPSVPGIVRLPSGRLVRGRGLSRPLPDGPVPAFGVYLLGRRPPAVPWESRWLRWPDFLLPADEADVKWPAGNIDCFQPGIHLPGALHVAPYSGDRCLRRYACSRALPASAVTSSVHDFGIPGVYGVRAWGTYSGTRTGVRVTVCLEDTVRSVYGAAAVGLAFDSSYRRHDSVSVVTIGYNHPQCRAMVTRHAGHLVVEALSGYKNGKVRQRGKLKRVY